MSERKKQPPYGVAVLPIILQMPIFIALYLGIVRKLRITSRPLYVVDPRFIGTRSLLHIAAADGRIYVCDAEDATYCTDYGPNASENDAVDASDLYRILPLVPSGSSTVLVSGNIVAITQQKIIYAGLAKKA